PQITISRPVQTAAWPSRPPMGAVGRSRQPGTGDALAGVDGAPLPAGAGPVGTWPAAGALPGWPATAVVVVVVVTAPAEPVAAAAPAAEVSELVTPAAATMQPAWVRVGSSPAAPAATCARTP